MATLGFHSEWLTIGSHRVLLEKRCGFPDDALRFVARVAAEICDHWDDPTGFGDDEAVADHDRPRLVTVFDDDGEAATTRITVAATDAQRVAGLDRRILGVFRAIYVGRRFECAVTIVLPGAVASPAYNHAEHLSVQAGIAADRFFPRPTDRPLS